MSAVSQNEKQALGEFCRVHREADDIKQELKMHSKQLAEIRKSGLSELTDLLQESKSTVYRLEKPNDDAGENFPTFVRLKTTSSSKSLNPDVLEQSMNLITKQIIADLAERQSEKPKKKRKTNAGAAASASNSDSINSQLVEILAEAVLTAIRKTRSSERQVADMTSSLPRGVDESTINDAPEHIQKCVTDMVMLQNKLKQLTKRFKDDLAELEQKESEVRAEVDQFLKRGNKDSFRLNVSVDGDRVPYYIRRRTVVTKKPMSVSEMKEHVHNTVTSLLRTVPQIQSVDDVSDEFVTALRGSVYQTLLYHLQNREKQEEEKILLHKGRGKNRNQNLSVYETDSQEEE